LLTDQDAAASEHPSRQRSRDEGGNIVRWYGTNTDIEELKRAELELRDFIDYAPLRIGIEAADGRRDEIQSL
jgi:hypothetical protein